MARTLCMFLALSLTLGHGDALARNGGGLRRLIARVKTVFRGGGAFGGPLVVGGQCSTRNLLPDGKARGFVIAAIGSAGEVATDWLPKLKTIGNDIGRYEFRQTTSQRPTRRQNFDALVLKTLRRLGHQPKQIAGKFVLENSGASGACPGYPQAVMAAAQQAGAPTIGVSPHAKVKTHRKHNAPYQGFDVIQLTKPTRAQLNAYWRGKAIVERGLAAKDQSPSLLAQLKQLLRGKPELPAYTYRTEQLIHTSDVAVVLNGRTGTTEEAMTTLEAGKPLIVVESSGGVAKGLAPLVNVIRNAGKRFLVIDARSAASLNRALAALPNESAMINVGGRPKRRGLVIFTNDATRVVPLATIAAAWREHALATEGKAVLLPLGDN